MTWLELEGHLVHYEWRDRYMTFMTEILRQLFTRIPRCRLMMKDSDISKILSNPKSNVYHNCLAKMSNIIWRPKMFKYLSLIHL